MGQLLQTLSTGATLAPSFTQATGEIQSYSGWIAGQSVGDANLSALLETVKTDSGTWYNTVYPTYLNMPSTILDSGQQISGDLAELIDLAQQLQTASTPQLEQQVTQYAGLLTTTLQTLQTQVDSLTSDLMSFQSKMAADGTLLSQGCSEAQAQVASLGNQLASNYGTLHSLQNASCPSQSDINACQNTINSLQAQQSTYLQDAGLFTQAVSSAQGAAASASYLSYFWQGVSTDIANCVKGLTGIASEPAAVLLINLNANQHAWNSLQAELQQMTN